jgi:hypothetical protein
MMRARPDDVPEIADWTRLLDGRVAVVTGGWFYSPTARSFTARPLGL